MTVPHALHPAQMHAQRHLLYVADPLCSWCYGFAPVIGAIADRYGAEAPVRVVMGGLRPGETRPTRDKDMAYLRAAWAQVARPLGGFHH